MPTPTQIPDDVLVSCLMVTKPGRLALMARSVAAFAQQTYRSRELVIVSSAADESGRQEIGAYLAALARPDIRLVFVPAEATLGAARNRSVAEARGRFVCQWDDDDLHHPSRLAAQMAAVRRAGQRVCYLQDVFHYAVRDKAVYWGDWSSTDGGVHPGTLLAERSAVPSYPESGREAALGEDTVVMKTIWGAGGFHAVQDQPHLFVYVAHGGNSWSADHHRMLVRRCARARAALLAREAEIRAGLSAFDLDGDIVVHGREGPAFALGAETPARSANPVTTVAPSPRQPIVLFAQELGSNFGHVNRLIAVARAFGPARRVFAVPHADIAGPLITAAFGTEVEIVGEMNFRAPGLAQTSSSGDSTLADVFHHVGYGHQASLDRAADRWRALVDRVSPDLIVCEFAPTLRLASWDRIPTVVVGGSYEIPPPDGHLPTIVPAGEPPGAESLAREQALCDVANAVRRRLGGPPLRFFADLFQGERVFCAAPPGCDPYAKQRLEPIRQPFPIPNVVRGPAFAARTGPEIFCFLWKDHPWLNLILTALNGLPRRSEIHIRGIDPKLLVAQCAPQVGIRPTSADFTTLLPQTRVFLHYGGAAASYWGLLAGTVQIIVPIHLEQEMTARGIIDHGGAVGLMVDKTATAERLRQIIVSVLDNRSLQQGALAAADRARANRAADPLPEIVAACRDLCRFRS